MKYGVDLFVKDRNKACCLCILLCSRYDDNKNALIIVKQNRTQKSFNMCAQLVLDKNRSKLVKPPWGNIRVYAKRFLENRNGLINLWSWSVKLTKNCVKNNIVG